MKLTPAKIGRFQTRNGRQVSLYQTTTDPRTQEERFTGLIHPTSPQGEPELGHQWKTNGEYSVSNTGVPHPLDLIENVAGGAMKPEDFLTPKA